MNKQIVTERAPEQTWKQLADEGAALEILELNELVREVRADCESYRMLALTTLDALRHTITERDKLRALIDHWIFEEKRSRKRANREGARAA